MARIRVLTDDVARQIAAGEVVERPASVIKELLENALDAGADNISIRVKRAGTGLMEVRDNGSGMARDDVELAPRSFSTSKITSASDLLSVQTYGFRGEALASISSVSHFDLISSATGKGEGWRVSFKGKKQTHNEPVAHEKGTTVRVGELFFNTPARRKFLKGDVTERRRILETILAFALIYPNIEIHYSDDGRAALDLVRVDDWRERIAGILGASTMKHMVPASHTSGDVTVEGFASLPTYTRANRNQQFVFVNKRLVREKTIIQAIHSAYRSVIPGRRFPAVVLSVQIPADEVDVNVHPNKLEVRLKQPRRVFDCVQRAIKAGLSGRAETTLDVSYMPEMSRDQSRLASSSTGPAERATTQSSVIPITSRPADLFRTRVEAAYGDTPGGSATIKEFNPQLSLKDRDPAEEDSTSEERKNVAPPPEAEPLSTDEGLFWQFNNAFIFVQVRGGVVVIDQHAAHERVIFDTSKKRLENEIPTSQQILFPITLELSLGEFDVFRTSKDVFHQLGFHLEPFGGKSILVRGYPSGLKNWEEGRLIRQIFDDMIKERFNGYSHSEQIIASFACRSAVKAGQKLSKEEMKMLADQLFAIPNPYSCPHGRPTIHRMSLEEIERWFARR